MPFTADAIAAQQVKERLKSIVEIIQDIEKSRNLCEQSLSNLQKYTNEEKGQSVQKTKSLIKNTMAHTEAEREVIQKALQKIYEIRNIKNERRIQARTLTANKEPIRKGTWMKMLQISGQTLPLFVGKIGEKAPPLCGAIPAERNYVAKTGDMVAAYVKGVDEEETWILAEVVSHNSSSNKYEIHDILKERSLKVRHILSKKKCIPLALMRANPETNPEALFPENTLVMALYPQTTCFYKAVIIKPPATHTDDYEVLFEDSSYPEGFSPSINVAQRFVIPCKSDNRPSSTVTSSSLHLSGTESGESEDIYSK